MNPIANYRKPKVYGASKLLEAPSWFAFRETYPQIEWTARWPDLHGNVKSDQQNSEMFWIRDFADIQQSDVVMVLAPKSDDHLRGALVEAGYGLGHGKEVLLIDERADWGSWRHHPMVRQYFSVHEAVMYLTGVYLERL